MISGWAKNSIHESPHYSNIRYKSHMNMITAPHHSSNDQCLHPEIDGREMDETP